ncbi:MAG: TonB family protein [Candidatus Sulfotelmatobacter sp.]
MRFATSIETWRAWEGRVLDGKFTLGRWLGGSDHSAVFATDQSPQPPSQAVIKLIAPEPGQADVQLSRWRAVAQLSHPNLIRIFETGKCKLDETPLLYVVMEQAEEDLSQILPQRALSGGETADLLPPLLDGLAYLHGKGFVHTRVRPSNVHAVGNHVKLSADQITAIANTGSTRRRRDVYDAPETAAGILSPTSDIWSLGVTLMAALTQNVPQNGEATHGDPGLPASIPEPFHGIVRECLHLDPQQRSTIAQIRARLAPSAAPAVVESKIPQASGAKPSRPPMFVAVAVLLALIGIFAFWKSRSSSPVAEQPASQSTSSQSAPAQTGSSAAPAISPSAKPAETAPASHGAVVRQILPEVSPSARRTVTGTIKIKVRVEVDASGKVTSAKLAAPVASRYFADHTLQAAKAWEFSPAGVDGQPAPSAWMLQFRIQRSGTHASADPISR